MKTSNSVSNKKIDDYDQLIEQYAAIAAEAEAERAHADALFDSIGDGAISTDADGNINRINQAALDILQSKAEDMLGKWFPETVVAVDEQGNKKPTIDRPITMAMMTGKPITAKSYYLIRNKIVPVAITVSPVMLNGTPIGAVEVFRDNTYEFEVDRMKSEFISIASHQLRTPLSAINTYARMLAKGYVGDLTPDQASFIKTIIDSVDKMNELITSLLDISRIESGKLEKNIKKLDFQAIVKKTVADLSGRASDRDITVSCKMPKKKIMIQADPVLLPEVCTNLITNAIKYTPEGGRVTVRLIESPKKITLSVTDTGYGIPESGKPRIFSKFFRGDNVVTKETSGTGLGLYLVKLIADTMGGKVWFKSIENQGSTFYFSLPKA